MSVEKLSTEAKSGEAKSSESKSSESRSSTWLGQAVQLMAIVLVVFLAKGAIAEPFYVPSGSRSRRY